MLSAFLFRAECCLTFSCSLDVRSHNIVDLFEETNKLNKSWNKVALQAYVGEFVAFNQKAFEKKWLEV